MSRANRSLSGANDFYGGGKNQSIQGIVALGTGAVVTQTKIIGSIPRDCIVTGIRMYAQSAPTATSLVGEVFARSAAGAAGNTLQASTADLDFATAAAAKTGVEATLTATQADRKLSENQLLEVVVTANTVNPGPGDLLVEVEFAPRFMAE